MFFLTKSTQDIPEKFPIPEVEQPLHVHDSLPEAKVFYFQNRNIANRVICLDHPQPAERIIFVPNWIAKPKHWIEFLKALHTNYTVIYFESREKRHTQYNARSLDFTLEQMGKDLANYLNQLKGSYHLVGASVGASSILKAWKYLDNPPKTLTLMCPLLQLQLPWHARLFPYVPGRIIRGIVPVFHKLTTYSERLKPLSRSLYQVSKEKNVQELQVLQASVKALLRMQIDPQEVQRIQQPSLVMRAIYDPIHQPQDVDQIAQLLRAEKAQDFPRFKSVYGWESAAAIVNWLEGK